MDSSPSPTRSPPAPKVIRPLSGKARPLSGKVRPLSGKVRQIERKVKGNVSEMNRRNEQARSLKSPVVCDDYQDYNMGPSAMSATVNIVRSPSKESIFEDIKRTLDKSMVNLDINNNEDNDITLQDDATIMLDTPEPPRDLDSRLSTHSQKKKVASIVCDKNGKTGMLSTVYLQGKPAADQKDNKDTESVTRVRSTSKETRLFHKRSEKERRQSSFSNKSGCIVIVNGKLANTGDIDDAKPRALSRAEIPDRVGSSLRDRVGSSLRDRIGSSLRNGLPKNQAPVSSTKRMPKHEMQRPHTEGSVDFGRRNTLPFESTPSPFVGRGKSVKSEEIFYYSSWKLGAR